MSLNTRICSSCNLPKDLDRFQKRSYTDKNGEVKYCYLSKCKDCKNTEARAKNPFSKEKRKKIRAIYYKNNKSKIRAKSDLYYENNKEKVIGKQKEYQFLNKDKVRATKVKSERKRMLDDPSFKLRRRVSSLIRDHIKRMGSTKNNNSILNFLPYTLDELKDHIQSQFEPWMSWNNWGNYNANEWDDHNTLTWFWQIDHIIPQYKLPFTSMEDDNFKKCWALENLRPLSAKQNLLDGVNSLR